VPKKKKGQQEKGDSEKVLKQTSVHERSKVKETRDGAGIKTPVKGQSALKRSNLKQSRRREGEGG